MRDCYGYERGYSKALLCPSARRELCSSGKRNGHKLSFYVKGGWRIIYLNYFAIWAVLFLLWIDYTTKNNNVIVDRITEFHYQFIGYEFIKYLSTKKNKGMNFTTKMMLYIKILRFIVRILKA